jgi:hypothetical protein
VNSLVNTFPTSNTLPPPLYLAIATMTTIPLAALGPPPNEAVYSNLDAVKAALQAHGGAHGYSIVIDSSIPDKKVVYKCSKGGKYRDQRNPDMHETKRRKNTSTTKTNCPFRVVAKKLIDNPGWKVEVDNEKHNHLAISELSALPQHRIASMTLEERAKVKELASLNNTPTQILDSLRAGNPGTHLISKDIYNLLASLRLEELNGKTPVEWLLNKLEELNYSPEKHINPDTYQLERLFFIHPDAIELWKQHPDIVLMDCTYKTNRFRMPLFNVCTVVGNKKTVQIGLCFLSGEKEPDYLWALNCLDEVMKKKIISIPICFVTD